MVACITTIFLLVILLVLHFFFFPTLLFMFHRRSVGFWISSLNLLWRLALHFSIAAFFSLSSLHHLAVGGPVMMLFTILTITNSTKVMSFSFCLLSIFHIPNYIPMILFWDFSRELLT